MTEWNLPLKLELKDPRQVRSFVTRQGRLTKGQRAALEALWPRFGLDAAKDDITKVGQPEQQRVLEIGFGNGDSLAQMGENYPDTLFFGVEVHQPGVGAILQSIEEKGIENIHLFYADARDVLAQAIPDGSLDRVQVYFPDPWPKKRHHKRRIIQTAFVENILPKLKQGGLFHCATDWGPYAEHMLEVLSGIDALENTSTTGGAMEARPEFRPETKFERRGQNLGHGVWDFVFRKK
ncbi:MAG: tRNA (guanosine(46)-N7)-methyltransferase TrmB [Pseudomonadota bacterium]|nr:tRNA (guanosine(46)-N7)-methyltransferase TrmB [Pseudomonadota bacterium]